MVFFLVVRTINGSNPLRGFGLLAINGFDGRFGGKKVHWTFFYFHLTPVYRIECSICGSGLRDVNSTVNTGETITPAYENCNLKPTFSLDKNSIKKGLATINAETGEVTPLKKGNVKVTATVGEGKNARKVTATVKIFDPVINAGKNNTVMVGKVLKASVKNGVKNTTDWKSSNEAVATVDSAGKIKGVSAGSATISCVNNGKLISREITVIENPKLKK